MKTTLHLLIAGCLLALPLKAQQEDSIKYRRSSIYSVMISHTDQKLHEEIGNVFLQMPVPDKYNNHNLWLRVIKGTKKMQQQEMEENFIYKHNIASQLVARWFKRDSITGQCSTDLIKERGLYNASEFDKELANRSARGKAMLEDAGEDLIGNTFVLINDITYIDKEQRSKKIGGLLEVAGGAATALTGVSLNQIGGIAGDVARTLKGFRVKIDTYLYRLVWDEETAMEFYTDYYSEEAYSEKSNAFEQNRGNFRLEYVGSQKSKGGTTSFVGINLDKPELMIRKACQRALDENIAMLQRNFESFKIKTPLISASPLCAEIGMKEGITADSKFEVLEAIIDENDKVIYNRVGIIKPIEGNIWDNRYMAAEEEAQGSELKKTTFRKVSGKDFYPGMLIREIK